MASNPIRRKPDKLKVSFALQDCSTYRPALELGIAHSGCKCQYMSNKVSISVKILPLLLVFRGWEWVGFAQRK